ncbi:hypothetical protein Leryth_000593 [Lithospermum erythrorhizon]|nr:hypothetical protein Leryth_000593 [Lithospermum erythrorhizon]
MEALVPYFSATIYRKRRSSNRKGRIMVTVSQNDVVNGVDSGGNEVSGHLQPAEALLSTSMEQKSSLLEQLPFQVPRGPRSRRSRRQISSSPDVGASEGCQVEAHVTAHRPSQKRRPTRRSADEKGCEIVIPRSRCRGQSRRGLKSSDIEKQKLDTSSFDKLLENLLAEFPEEKRVSFICLDSLWFSLYSNNKGNRSNVLKWIKKKEIFTKKYVMVPIVMWGHWSLLILCHFGDSGQSKFRTPCMLLLDSLKEANPKRLEPEIRRFILDIITTEQRPLGKEQVKKIPLLVPKVPQQNDDKECGNFVLYYINLFVENAPENFSISDGYPYFMTENWFDREGVESFYRRLGLLRNTIDASDQDNCNASDTDASDELIEL